MPTSFTHAISGAVLAPLAPAPVSPRKAALALAAVAIAPDLDVVGFYLGVPYGHPLGHRGLFHSLPFSALLALGVVLVCFREIPRASRAFFGMTALVFVAASSHGLLDAATDGGRGVGLLLPFDRQRYFLPWRPLPTSPLELDVFLGPRGFSVLRRETWLVGAPCAALFVALALLRRLRGRGPAGSSGGAG